MSRCAFFSPKAWKTPEERGEIFHAEGENGAEGMRFYYREYHILFPIFFHRREIKHRFLQTRLYSGKSQNALNSLKPATSVKFGYFFHCHDFPK